MNRGRNLKERINYSLGDLFNVYDWATPFRQHVVDLLFNKCSDNAGPWSASILIRMEVLFHSVVFRWRVAC